MSKPNSADKLITPHIELHTSGCSWNRNGHTCDCGTSEDLSACSSAEEQGPSKPGVAGSNPARRAIQIAQLELALEVSLTLVRDCPQTTKDTIIDSLTRCIQELNR
jgi:hypothetical protein